MAAFYFPRRYSISVLVNQMKRQKKDIKLLLQIKHSAIRILSIHFPASATSPLMCGRNGDRNTPVASARASSLLYLCTYFVRVKRITYNSTFVWMKWKILWVAKSASSRVEDALYNRGQGFYVPMLIHSRRLGVN